MAGNLEFIKSASGTSVSSLDVTDCFSADYDVYKVIQKNYTPLSATSQSNIRLINSSGTVISTSSYSNASLFMPSYSSFVEDRRASSTLLVDAASSDQNDTLGVGAVYYIFNPFSSSYTFATSQLTYFDTGSGLVGRKGIGVLETTDSITGLQFISTGSASITTSATVYGLASN